MIYTYQAVVQDPETLIEIPHPAIMLAFSPVLPTSKERSIQYDLKMW